MFLRTFAHWGVMQPQLGRYRVTVVFWVILLILQVRLETNCDFLPLRIQDLGHNLSLFLGAAWGLHPCRGQHFTLLQLSSPSF